MVGEAVFAAYSEIAEVVKKADLAFGDEITLKKCSPKRNKDVVVLHFKVTRNVVPITQRD